MYVLAFAIVLTQLPPEADQLRLLADADAYYQSSGRVLERSVSLYDDVLRTVDLSDENRTDILFRVGSMYLSDRDTFPSDTDRERARQYFLQVVAIGLHADGRVFQSRNYIGSIHHFRREYDEAARWYVSVWKEFYSLSEEERQGMSFSGAEIAVANAGAMLAGRANLGFADPGIKQLYEEFADDGAFQAELDKGIRQWQEFEQEQRTRLSEPSSAQAMERHDDGIAARFRQRAIRAASPSEGTTSDDGTISYIYASSVFREAFPSVIFSTEFGPASWDTQPDLQLPDFRVYRNQRLSDALDHYCTLTQGAMAWRTVGETVVLYPVLPSNGDDGVPLDRVIEFSIEDATIEEALAVWSAAVEGTGVDIDIHDGCEEELRKTPAVFFEGAISVDAMAVDAREALWAIIERAPVPLRYFVISNGSDRTSVIVSVFDTKGRGPFCGESTR